MNQRVPVRLGPAVGAIGRSVARRFVDLAERIADATIAVGRAVGGSRHGAFDDRHDGDDPAGSAGHGGLDRTSARFARAALRRRAGALPRLIARLPSRVAGVRTGGRHRRLAALARHPLPSLYDLHPEARSLVPRQLGLKTVPVDEIVGTAVAGPAQRGGDFLPLPPFRSSNWEGRWQRIRRAVDRLAVLPPVDLVRYAEGYWVEDGHNRVAAALYAGQVAIDASVIALVAPGAALTEAPSSLAADLVGSGRLRAAGKGRRPAIDVYTEDS